MQTEFGGANPISMSEYYAGGSYVPASTSGANGAVPSSGAISMSKLYGTSNVIYTPAGGLSAGAPASLDDMQTYPGDAFVTITCNRTATWSWVKSGSTAAYATIANGSTGTTIQFVLPSSNTIFRSATFTVSATANGVTRYWTVQLDTETNL